MTGETELYAVRVEADSAITVEASSVEDAKDIVKENTDTGDLGSANIRTVGEF